MLERVNTEGRGQWSKKNCSGASPKALGKVRETNKETLMMIKKKAKQKQKKSFVA